MADTKRTLTELLALLADNNTGDISAQDLRDFLVSVYNDIGYGTENASTAAELKDAVNKSHDIYVEYRILDKDISHEVAAGVGGDFRIPDACNVLEVGAYIDTAGITNPLTIDIKEAGISILSTLITIDSTKKSSKESSIPPVISDPNIAADAILTFDITTISDTPGKGLVVWMKIRLV